MKTVLLTLAVLATLAGIFGAVVLYTGAYNVAATERHFAVTYRLIDIALHRAVERRSDGIEVPPLDDPVLIERGLIHYRAHCIQCHGAPGVPPEPFALGLEPLAANLAFTARAWPPAEIFWVVRNGIRMTGMPAWKYRMPEEDLWAIVAFVGTLPRLSPEEYAVMVAEAEALGREHAHRPAAAIGEPDVGRGKVLMHQYACVTCHHIPGVVGPDAPVGPPLTGIGSRAVIAGVLPNEPGAMERWLQAPQEVAPRSAMPDLGVGPRDAQDMAAFLSTLK